MESRLRIIAVSALAAFFAPLVFVSIIVLRKAERRFNFHARALEQAPAARDRALELGPGRGPVPTIPTDLG